MAVRQYVGARYVPKFADPITWESGKSYEAMTIVLYNNDSYTSKVPVPANIGTPPNNSEYWALTGNFNGQLADYAKKTEQAMKDAEEAKETVSEVKTGLEQEATARSEADTALEEKITQEATARFEADTALEEKITQEATARSEADTALEEKIDNIQITGLKSNDVSAEFVSRFLRDYEYASDSEVTIQQGCAIIDETTAVCVLNNSAETAQKLVKVNYKTGTVISTKSGLSGMGHGNDATYNPTDNSVLIAISGNKGIMRYDASTLNYLNTVATSLTCAGITYDRKQGRLFSRNANTYTELNPSTYDVIETKSFTEPDVLSTNVANGRSYRQGSVSYDGLVGTLYYAPNCIVFYDFDNGGIAKMYSIPRSINDVFNAMELESGDFVNGTELITAFNYALANNYKCGTAFIKLDLDKNVVNGDLLQTATNKPTTGVTLHCSASSTAGFPDGSSTKPFRYLQEAIDCALTRNNQMVLINLDSAGDYGICYVTGYSGGLRIIGPTTGVATVNGILCERCGYIDIRNVTVSPVITGAITYGMNINQCHVALDNVILGVPDTVKDYYCAISEAQLDLYNGSATFTSSNGYSKYAFATQKNSILNNYGFTYSSNNIPNFALIRSGSSGYRRPPGSITTYCYESGYANPSLVTIANTQTLSPNSNLTLANLNQIPNGIAYLHNMVHFVFLVNVSGNPYRFDFFARLFGGSHRYDFSFQHFNSQWYSYEIRTVIDASSNIIRTTEIIAKAADGSDVSQTDTTNYPQLETIEIMRC